MKASLLTTISLLLFLAAVQTTHAGDIKCWKNRQKIRECGGTVPPEYAQQRIEVLNEQGIVVRIIEPRKSKAQLAREAREAKRQAAIAERRRQDLILLKTYTTEQDLLVSRDKKIATIDGSISITNGNLRILNSSLEQLQKQAANHERSGNKIPGQLIADMASVKKQISDNENHRRETEKKRVAIMKKYDDDLKRYRKLKRDRLH